jgi:DNA-binding response OmpR family regulator
MHTDRDRAAGVAQPGTRDAGADPRTLSILVVEDNVDSAEATAYLVRAMGHEVDVAHDGATALELAVAYEPSLILLDLGLPDFDGFELVSRLRAVSWARIPPVLVAVTGWSSDDDRRRAAAIGIDEYLVKPVRFETLRDLVTRIACGVPETKPRA